MYNITSFKTYHFHESILYIIIITIRKIHTILGKYTHIFSDFIIKAKETINEWANFYESIKLHFVK